MSTSPTYGDLISGSTHGAFAIVGDLQRTTLFERCVLRRESNGAETIRLIAELAAEKIDFAAILGDFVAWQAEAHWRFVDRALAPLREKAVPILPLFGNHDLWGRVDPMLRRFPVLAKNRWYARDYRRTRIFWLDSSVARAGGSEAERQREWLNESLRRSDADPAIDSVIVLDHHPPFTNSRVTGDERGVQAEFLPAVQAARKVTLFVSGHAHAYERFAKHGKTFLVTGGGGGPRVGLLDGKRRRHPDQCNEGVPRPFHYLIVRPDASGALAVEARGFQKGAPSRAFDRILIPSPPVVADR